MVSLGPRTLARQAARLNLSSRYAGRVSPLILMTDDDRLVDPGAAAANLPRGSTVIVRSRDAERRERLAVRILEISRTRGLLVLIADDPVLALRLGADGIHLPERRANLAPRWRARKPGWFITTAAHSLFAVVRAGSFGIDAVVLSPVLATVSHPGVRPLSPARANLIATHSPIPVYALGGINGRSGRRLGPAFAGIAAIAGLTVG
jgi:thiamine-phosphate pyrophosphorylase